MGLGFAMSLEETFTNLAAFLNSLDAEGEQKFELSHSLVIICPDCGKNIAFRGRCPKCGGNSWIPAGHAGGIFERVQAQHTPEVQGAEKEEPEQGAHHQELDEVGAGEVAGSEDAQRQKGPGRGRLGA